MDDRGPKPYKLSEFGSKEFQDMLAREEREFDAACPWKLNPETLVLFIPDEGDRSYYEVDLEECTSSAPILDRIVQVSGKSWLSDAEVGALVRKLDRVLDLQATVCGTGTDRKMDPIAHMKGKGLLK